MIPSRLAALGSLVVTLVAAAPARADVPPGTPDAAAGAPFPGPPAIAPVMTAEQFFYFSELVGEPRPVVWQRLQADPTLVPLAVAAADARRERRSSGKTRMAVGFSIFGVGGITGYVVMLSALATECDYDYDYGTRSCGDRMGNRFLLGALIVVASAGLGLGVGIPGIVGMARRSEAETAAVDRYQYPRTLMPSHYARVGSAVPGFALKLPLLSLCF